MVPFSGVCFLAAFLFTVNIAWALSVLEVGSVGIKATKSLQDQGYNTGLSCSGKTKCDSSRGKRFQIKKTVLKGFVNFWRPSATDNDFACDVRFCSSRKQANKILNAEFVLMCQHL